MVTSVLKLITRHNQLNGSTKLPGYETQKRISYEVQPNTELELAKRY
jgi:hypothetical protein